MKLSRTVSYAVQATLQLAQSDPSTPVPCSKLASDGDMPERFLLQILRVLVTHGILRSTRGVDGGYALTKPADQISLLEVIEAIDGPMDSESLNWEVVPPETAQAKLQTALMQVTDTARRQLESIKLSQLLQPPDLPVPEEPMPGCESPEVRPEEDNPSS
jgi:Rrf2 family transcriptional regulator, cysteine metabolism repressor